MQFYQKIKTLSATFAIAFLDNFGYSIVFILFAPLVLDPQYGMIPETFSPGTKNILLGALVGIFPLFLFFGAPFWGDIGDLSGRRKALLSTVAGTIFGHLLTAWAIVAQSYLFLLFARAVAGFLAGNLSICLASISDLSVEKQEKARNFGLLTVFMGIGWIGAMFVGGYLSDPQIASFFSPTLPFYFSAFLTAIGWLFVYFFFEETHERRLGLSLHWMKAIRDIRSALEVRLLRIHLWILLLWSLGWFFTFQWFTPVGLEFFQVDQESISTHLMALGFCWILGGVLFNPFVLRIYNSRQLSLYSSLLLMGLLGICSFTSSFALFSFFFALSALVAPIALSNILNELSHAAPLEIQGKAMGFGQSIQALAGIVVPFGGGLLAHISIRAIYPLSVLLLALSCCSMIWYGKKRYK